MHFLQFYMRVKAWTEAHFFYEALQNVYQSTLLHTNKTTKKYIQFLTIFQLYRDYQTYLSVFQKGIFYEWHIGPRGYQHARIPPLISSNISCH
jgi:hypothetical protein